ncbi:MAG: ABC transporter permease [Acidimicrobiales bacterium]
MIAVLTIKQLTIKQLTANKMRLFATALAVIMGVAFLSGTLILTDTIRGTFNTLLATADEGTDAYVRAASPLEVGYGESGSALDAALLDTVRGVEGVDEAAIQVSGYAQILDKAGKAVGSPQTGVLGENWVTVSTLNPFTIVDGRAPTGPDEIAIDKRSAELAKLQVGDRTTVLSARAPRPATIVGITRFGDVDTPGGLSVVLFDDVTAQAVLNQPGQIDAIAVTARNGVKADELVARIAPIVGAGNEVITGAALTTEHQHDIGKDISQFGLFLTMFSLIALFVGAFVINNTFSIIVSQRTKEMALLRAVGASGRQVRLAVLAEAAITGLVASAAGLVGGIGVANGLRALLSALGVDIPLDTLQITTITVAGSLAAGVLITLAAAVLPARRAARVAPIAALRDIAQDRSALSTQRAIVGGAAALVAVTVMLVGGSAADTRIVGAGALALMVAVTVLGPVLARPVAAALGAPLVRLRATAAAIARENAMRNPKRTARTASSLMIGVALVSFLAIFAASIKSSGAGAFRNDFRGTVIIDSGAIDGTSGLTPQIAAQLATQPGVNTVTAQRITAIETDGAASFLNAYNASTVATMFDLGHIEGDIANLGTDGIAVAAGTGPDAARLGDTRTITFQTGPSTFTVRAIYEHASDTIGDQFVDLSAFETHLTERLDSRIYLNAEDTSTIETAAHGYPTAKVLTTEAFIAQQNGSLDAVLTLMYALLGLAVLIALLGIANTLALSIHERKRELGLLRAVGMTRAQVRSSVRWESAIIALFGTTLGLIIGTFLAWTMVQAITTGATTRFIVPTGSLIIVAAVATIAGVAAALLPARRAARIDILTALSTA